MSMEEVRTHDDNRFFGTGKEGRQKVVIDTLPTAYFFVYEQVVALNSWNRLIQDPEFRAGERYNIVGTLAFFSSHHNAVYPYMGDCINGGIESLPENGRYKRLFITTKAEYSGLGRKALRYVFVGEEALSIKDPEKIITLTELQGWMITHSQNPDGLIQNVGADGVQNKTTITEIASNLDLVRYFMINEINSKNGAYVDKVGEALFNRFSAEVYRLAVQKLACGMAVVDQIIQESANVEIPIPIGYRPHEIHAYTLAELPPLEQLWEQSYLLVTALAETEGLPSFLKNRLKGDV